MLISSSGAFIRFAVRPFVCSLHTSVLSLAPSSVHCIGSPVLMLVRAPVSINKTGTLQCHGMYAGELDRTDMYMLGSDLVQLVQLRLYSVDVQMSLTQSKQQLPSVNLKKMFVRIEKIYIMFPIKSHHSCIFRHGWYNKYIFKNILKFLFLQITRMWCFNFY